jgi:hypothetical protein
MKHLYIVSSLFLFLSAFFSAGISSVDNWCEENVLQLRYFQNDVKTLPVNIQERMQTFLTSAFCYSDVTKSDVTYSAINPGQIVLGDHWSIGHQWISNRENINGFYSPAPASNLFFFTRSPSDKVTQTPLPFMLFGIGFLSFLKMKWIRLKNKLELQGK